MLSNVMLLLRTNFKQCFIIISVMISALKSVHKKHTPHHSSVKSAGISVLWGQIEARKTRILNIAIF
jgi:hypothetical protein